MLTMTNIDNLNRLFPLVAHAQRQSDRFERLRPALQLTNAPLQGMPALLQPAARERLLSLYSPAVRAALASASGAGGPEPGK